MAHRRDDSYYQHCPRQHHPRQHRPRQHRHKNRREYRYDNEESSCEFPHFPNRRWGNSIWIGITVFAKLFLAAFGGMLTNLILTLKFINTDNTGFAPGDLNFSLFKNSRFASCSSLVPDLANCTTIMEIINLTVYDRDQHYLRRGYIPISSSGQSRDGRDYDWCTIASCFNGYQAIPTSARPNAIGLTNFTVWTNVNLVAFIFLATYLKRNWDIWRSADITCRGGLRTISFIDWVVLLYTVSSNVIWWWVDYGQFAKDPVQNTTVSVFAWTTTWLLASNMHYHPYSCALSRWPAFKRTLSWLVAVLAVVQWCATVHLLAVGWGDSPVGHGGITQGYDCTATFLREPSTEGQCSAERLCSDATLLSNVPFSWAFADDMIVGVAFGFFTLFSLAAVQPFVFASCRFVRGAGSWDDQFKRCDIGPIAGPALVGSFGAFYADVAASVAVKLLNLTDREAPLVAYPPCNAIHVGLSTWRSYLDVDPGSRALRVVKSWFNA